MHDDAVQVDAVKKVHKFKQSLEARTKGSEKHPYKPVPGEYFVPEVWTRRKDDDGNEVYQTYGEWVEKMAKEQAK